MILKKFAHVEIKNVPLQQRAELKRTKLLEYVEQDEDLALKLFRDEALEMFPELNT